jgi:DNA repair protein RadC
LSNSAITAQLIRSYLAGIDREHFIVLLLNRKNEVIGINTVSVGSLTASVVSPREVFKPAILANAAALIAAHNHPSGDPKPSAEDRAMTERLYQAGKLLDIQLLDHIIIGDGTTRYYSFADNGALAG